MNKNKSYLRLNYGKITIDKCFLFDWKTDIVTLGLFFKTKDYKNNHFTNSFV
jgi:hypothetical protein